VMQADEATSRMERKGRVRIGLRENIPSPPTVRSVRRFAPNGPIILAG